MWDIKLKAMNIQTRQTNKNSQTQTTVQWLPDGKGMGGSMVKWVKYMVTEDDLTLGGGHTLQCTGHVSQKYMLETYIILLINVAPINLILKLKK